MKCRIITAEGPIKLCPKCNNDIFRKSTKTRYTNPEKTKGETRELTICDNCGYTEIANSINFEIQK